MRRALEGLAGVESVTMRFEDKEFDIAHDGQVTAAKLIETVVATGFKASLVSEKPVDGEK